MKIYLVDYWMPFPSSEYGGLQCVIAEDVEECVRIIMEDVDDIYKGSRYEKDDLEERIRSVVQQAKVLELAEGYTAGIVEEFTT